MASATSDSATYGDTAAPESASSTDGMTRSMLAMMLFNQAKGEHDALKAAGEAADPDGKLLKAFHERWAVQCHNFAVVRKKTEQPTPLFLLSLFRFTCL